MEELLAHSSWVWQLARRLVDDDERAHDVVQETWARALRRPPELTAGGSPRPWLHVVVRSVAAQFHRADRRREAREVTAARPEALPPIDRVLAREEARRVVVEAVLGLPEPYREAIVLRYFDELSPGALAKRLGVPGSTVRTRLQRGHALLRARLESQRRDDESNWLTALVPLIPRRGPLAALSSGAALVSTKFFVLSAAAVAAALLVWFAVSSEAKPDAHSAASNTEFAQLDAPKVASGDAPSARAAAADAQAVPAVAATPAARDMVRVRVVERSTGKPVPGATVLFGSEDDIGPVRSADLERDLQEHGEQLVADAKGECEFPYHSQRYMHCAARSGDLWGQTYAASARADVVVIELVRDREVDVLVVDRDGHPVVGVPLTLVAGGAGSWYGSTEAPLGIARIRHFDVVAPRPWELSEMLVTFAFPQAELRAARIDLAALPSEPLRLELPPHGSIRLHVVHPGGERVSARYSVTASVRSGISRGGIRQFDDGELVLPYVGLGLDVQLFGSPIWPETLEGFSCTVHGPERDGEERTAEVEIPLRAATPHLRLIDADGAAIGSRAVAWWLYSGQDEDPGTWGRTRTDALGNFAIDADRKRLQFGTTDLRVVVPRDEAHAELGATLHIELARIARDADLGVLRVLPLPTIASGVVLDDRELPIARAEVQLQRRNPLVPSPDPQANPSATGPTMVAQAWDTVPLRTATTDAQGRFTIGGEDPTGELALEANAIGCCGTSPMPVAYGASDVVLRLARGGSVAGSLRLPHPSMATALWARINPTGDSDRRHGAGCAIAFDGYFNLGGVPTGSYRFALSLNSTEPRVDLLTIDDVLVTAGETSRDPRLANIELGERVHLFELEVTSASGEPIRAGGVAFAHPGGEPSKRGAEIREGHATIVSDARELDLIVHAPGYRVQRQTATAGRTRIALLDGIEIGLRLGGEVELDPKLAIDAVLRAPAGTVAYDDLRVRVPREGARLRLPFDGSWTITWQLVDRERQADRPLRSDTLDVRPGDIVREAVLALTQSELDAALGKFGPKKRR